MAAQADFPPPTLYVELSNDARPVGSSRDLTRIPGYFNYRDFWAVVEKLAHLDTKKPSWIYHEGLVK